MSTEKERDLFKQRLSDLQAAASHYFSQARTKKERMFVVEMMGELMRNLTRDVGKALGLGCPPHAPFLCRDGSCVSDKRDCKGRGGD